MSTEENMTKQNFISTDIPQFTLSGLFNRNAPLIRNLANDLKAYNSKLLGDDFSNHDEVAFEYKPANRCDNVTISTPSRTIVLSVPYSPVDDIVLKTTVIYNPNIFDYGLTTLHFSIAGQITRETIAKSDTQITQNPECTERNQLKLAMTNLQLHLNAMHNQFLK
jgi:hypothetical protein